MSDINWTDRFDPYEFEEFVAELWKNDRYTTVVRKGSGDRGIDIEATRGSIKKLIQVKLYSPGNKIGSKDVRKYATLYQQVPDADDVIIVTSSSFTSEAENLAEDLDVQLVDDDEIADKYNESNVNLADFARENKSSEGSRFSGDTKSSGGGSGRNKVPGGSLSKSATNPGSDSDSNYLSSPWGIIVIGVLSIPVLLFLAFGLILILTIPFLPLGLISTTLGFAASVAFLLYFILFVVSDRLADKSDLKILNQNQATIALVGIVVIPPGCIAAIRILRRYYVVSLTETTVTSIALVWVGMLFLTTLVLPVITDG